MQEVFDMRDMMDSMFPVELNGTREEGIDLINQFYEVKRNLSFQETLEQRLRKIILTCDFVSRSENNVSQCKFDNGLILTYKKIDFQIIPLTEKVLDFLNETNSTDLISTKEYRNVTLGTRMSKEEAREIDERAVERTLSIQDLSSEEQRLKMACLELHKTRQELKKLGNKESTIKKQILESKAFATDGGYILGNGRKINVDMTRSVNFDTTKFKERFPGNVASFSTLSSRKYVYVETPQEYEARIEQSKKWEKKEPEPDGKAMLNFIREKYAKKERQEEDTPEMELSR